MPGGSFVEGQIPTLAEINAFLTGPIVAADIDTDAVETAKLADDAVTTAKILDAVVTSRKMALAWQSAQILTNETTTSTSYTDLATAGPAVTVSPGTTQTHLLWFNCDTSNTGANRNVMAIAVNGGAPSDNEWAGFEFESTLQASKTMGSHIFKTGQVSGAVHTAKYKVTGGTGSFSKRRLTCLPG